jgi:vacuolar-type H+-ATPase subunit E/Vma4
MDRTPLESSIWEESRSAIQAIRDKEAACIQELDAACDAEIAAFKDKIEEQIRSRIQQEVFKLKNRGIVERRKNKLHVVEEFITSIVDEAVRGIRQDARYQNFLVDAIRDALEKINGSADVSLKKEDLVFREEIMAVVMDKGKGPVVAISNNDTIVWGGCIVHDAAGGRIFNSTIERIYYRKSPAIRREVVRILKERGLAY